MKLKTNTKTTHTLKLSEEELRLIHEAAYFWWNASQTSKAAEKTSELLDALEEVMRKNGMVCR